MLLNVHLCIDEAYQSIHSKNSFSTTIAKEFLLFLCVPNIKQNFYEKCFFRKTFHSLNTLPWNCFLADYNMFMFIRWIINKLHNRFYNPTIFGTNKIKSILDLPTKFQLWISKSFSLIAIQWHAGTLLMIVSSVGVIPNMFYNTWHLLPKHTHWFLSLRLSQR